MGHVSRYVCMWTRVRVLELQAAYIGGPELVVWYVVNVLLAALLALM